MKMSKSTESTEPVRVNPVPPRRVFARLATAAAVAGALVGFQVPFAPPAAAASSWQTPLAMGSAQARSEHTATRLNDGRVLVVGGHKTVNFGNGCCNINVVASNLLYEVPAGGIPVWRQDTAMTEPRSMHTATLLDDGRVFVAGGCGDSTCSVALATTWLYTAGAFGVNGTWQQGPNMVTPGKLGTGPGRYHHTATKLSDGRVLLAGGEDTDGEGLATAEVYTPATGAIGQITATGSLQQMWNAAGDTLIYGGRTSHTATLVGGADVLVTGGTGMIGSGAGLNDAQRWSPTTGVWTSVTAGNGNTALMGVRRQLHSATLLTTNCATHCGKVLVAGGFTKHYSWLEQAVTATAELFDPATGGWTATGSMVSDHGIFDNDPTKPLTGKRFRHTATEFTAGANSGQVLVTGGISAVPFDIQYSAKSATVVSTSERWNPTTGTWTTDATMATKRTFHSATLLATNDRVLVVAGATQGNVTGNFPPYLKVSPTSLSTSERYIP